VESKETLYRDSSSQDFIYTDAYTADDDVH